MALEKIKKDDFVEFLSEKKISPLCPSCHHNDWYVPEDFSKERGGIMMISSNGAFNIPPPHIPVAFMVCNNCGHVRTYAIAIIDKWMKSKAK